MPKRNILITGGAGFIGSNFIPFFLEQHQDIFIINLDKLTYAGNLQHLKEIENNNRYKFIQGDICDVDLVSSIFDDYQITDVIHFAAESHVENSVRNQKRLINSIYNV